MAQRGEKYRLIRGPDGEALFYFGILADGTFNYPEDVVRAEMLAATRSEAAKRAAVTRKRRRLNRENETAQKILAGHRIGPRSHCAICGRGLDNPESIGGVPAPCAGRTSSRRSSR